MIITTKLSTRTVYQMVHESEEVVEMMEGFCCHTLVMPWDDDTVINIEKFITVPEDNAVGESIYVVGTFQPQNIPISVIALPVETVYIVSLKVEEPTPDRPSLDLSRLN